MDAASKFTDIRTTPFFAHLEKNPIAYFCAEYALTTSIPTYAGGLGVLAGDYIREAADQQLPVVGVGLYYNEGYETLYRVNEQGHIEDPHVHARAENRGLAPVLDEMGNRVYISVPVENKEVIVQAWKWQIGSVVVYLLDTDVDGNDASDRKITDHLYIVDKQIRFKQEIVLGIGGVRLLEKLGITPSIYHLNEGHSGLLLFELAKMRMANSGLHFTDALTEIGKKTVFTNHTLVIAGNDMFSRELAELMLSGFAREADVSIHDIVGPGMDEMNSFSLTTLALKTCAQTNAVSKIHAKMACQVWPFCPTQAITNGIHIPSWDAIDQNVTMWEAHLANKRLLLNHITLLTGEEWDDRTLLIGWARRFVAYKRPLAIFDDLERLKKLATNANRPFKLVLAGTLHPSDKEGAEMLERIRHSIASQLQGSVAYLPTYNLDVAKLLTAGCDIWLNTPKVGYEACGTSGMKAALNGCLPFSTKDGWVAEVDMFEIGWTVEDEPITKNILDMLENKIVPLYYSRQEDGIPFSWIKNMQNARELVLNEFSATRMLYDYIEKLYMPNTKIERR